MKYDFKAPLRNSQGTVVRISNDDSGPWTAQVALKDALLNDNEENQHSKMARYELFLKLRDHTADTEYSAEEVSLLKKTALVLPTIFAGQIAHILDQKVK